MLWQPGRFGWVGTLLGNTGRGGRWGREQSRLEPDATTWDSQPPAQWFGKDRVLVSGSHQEVGGNRQAQATPPENMKPLAWVGAQV